MVTKLTGEEIIEKLKTLVDNSITSWSQFPSPYEMLGMKEAVELFITTVNNNGRILFVHDSDADGLGTYMLSYIFFKHFNYKNVEVIITNRSQGYGFLPIHLTDRLNNLPSLVITADNGITAHDACNKAAELGVKVIITDHHQVDIHKGKPNAIIVDPHQDGCPFKYKEINGTFVYWFFLKAIIELSKIPIDVYKEFLPELCLTTISDVMPLHHLNRFVVTEGLKVFNTHPRTWSRIFSKVYNKDNITAETLAFNLIPAINATGRLTNAEESAVFMTREDERESENWFKYIKSLNDVRKEKQVKLQQDIANFYGEWIKAPFIIIPGDNFEKGILGPVAGKIAEQYKKPTIVLSKNKEGTHYSGSGRSVGNVDILSLVKNNPYVVQEKTGGHKVACGVQLKVEDLNNFWTVLQQDTLKVPKEDYIDVSKDIFSYLELRDVDYDLYREIEKFQPFGHKFQKPLFLSKGTFKKVAKIGKDKNHYSMTITDDLGCELRGVYFFFTQEVKSKETHYFTFNIAEDSYNSDPEAICLQINNILSEEEYLYYTGGN